MKTTVRRIKDINELVESGFGQQWPRHGLQLLYWFVHECIYPTNNDEMTMRCDPERGDFGFHLFENRYIQRNRKLLPDMRFPYYLVGNLKSPGADMLPALVKEVSAGHHDANSNADRIIVNVQENRKMGKVYVTTHKNQSNYDSRATFHITRTLIWIIILYKSIDDFLEDTGYQKTQGIYQMLYIAVSPERDITDTELQISSRRSDISTHTNSHKEKKRCVCGCTIL